MSKKDTGGRNGRISAVREGQKIKLAYNVKLIFFKGEYLDFESRHATLSKQS